MDAQQKRRTCAVFAIMAIAALVLAFLLMGSNAQKTSANELVASTIIRTHEHMSIPDHVFMSKAERCRIPTSTELANITGTKPDQWSVRTNNNHAIIYHGDDVTVVSIQIRKDQMLVDLATNKAYTFGDVFTGTQPFFFRCYNSRNRLFNADVKSICTNGETLLEESSDRNWIAGTLANPWIKYLYEKHRFMPSFFVPSHAEFEVYYTDRATHILVAGYLTDRIPHRDSTTSMWVAVSAFC